MFKSEKEIEDESKRIKWRTITGLLKMYSIFFILIIYWVYFHPSTLVEQTSQSGEKEVIIKEHGNGLLGGGYITVVIKKDGNTVKRKRVGVELFFESNHKGRYTINWNHGESVVDVSMNFENTNKLLSYNYDTLNIEIKDEYRKVR